MKPLFFLLVLIIVLASVIFVLDYRLGDNLYRFCTAQSSGNSIDRISANAKQFNVKLESSDDHKRIYIPQSKLPFIGKYACEIKIKQQKVVHQEFINLNSR